MTPVRLRVRRLGPADFRPVVSQVDAWWGRPVRGQLQRLFFDHFSNTSFVVEDDEKIVAFLIGFLSPARDEVAYVHFVGVDPRYRGRGLARDLYERFIDIARADGRTELRAVTSPENRGSIGFHRQLGFELEPSPFDSDGSYVHQNYGPNGEARVLFVKRLGERV